MGKGDHLKVKRGTWYWGGIYHHGIDVGGGNVVHLTGPTKEEASVQKTTREVFANGSEVEVVYYSTEMCLDPNLVVWMADSFFIAKTMAARGEIIKPADPSVLEAAIRISQAQQPKSETYQPDPKMAALYIQWLACIQPVSVPGSYSFVNWNCEHFATFCKTGMKSSNQKSEAIFTILRHVGMLGRANPHMIPLIPLIKLTDLVLKFNAPWREAKIPEYGRSVREYQGTYWQDPLGNKLFELRHGGLSKWYLLDSSRPNQWHETDAPRAPDQLVKIGDRYKDGTGNVYLENEKGLFLVDTQNNAFVPVL